MNLRDLTYLVAVAEHQHFGRAAHACNISQPALSMQLQKLEASLGTLLFERTNKKVSITPVGEAIVARAKELLRSAEDIRQIAKTYQDPLGGDFRLGAFPTLAPYYLPKVIPKIHRALPKLNLLLIEEKTQRLLEMLKAGELDAAFIALPLEDPELVAHPIFSDPFLLAVPKTHPLAKNKNTCIGDITHEHLLLLEEGHCLREQALEACRIASGSEYKKFRGTSLETLRQMVVANVGVTLIPQTAVEQNSQLVYIPFKKPAPKRTIALVTRRTLPRKERIDALMRCLKS